MHKDDVARIAAEQSLRMQLARAKSELPHLAAPDDTVAVPIDDLERVLGPEWQSIETMPRDWTISMVAWPHSQMDTGWMLDFWSGKYLAEMEESIAKGLRKNSPHLFWLPTHWKPMPAPPHGEPRCARMN